ncbi:hypothetical protein GCM10009624_09540 [Gordonia sinesedis]
MTSPRSRSVSAAEVLDRLGADATAAAGYLRDTYLLESVDQLGHAGVDPVDVATRHSILLLKPDAIVARSVAPTLDWLAETGWRVVYAARVPAGRHLARALWAASWATASPERRRLADLLVGISDAIALVVADERGGASTETAPERLTREKGPTDPRRRVPGQLRHLLGRYSYLLNLVHSPDDPAEVLREFAIVLDEPDRARCLAAITGSLDGPSTARSASGTARSLADTLYASTPAASFARDEATCRIVADLRAAGRPVTTDDETALLAGDDGRAAAVIRDAWNERTPLDPWSVIVLGSYVLPMAVTPAGGPPAPAGDGDAGVRHTQTIPREWVHRCSVAEVFVTSVGRVGAAEFVLGAQLPRMHAYYGDHTEHQAAHHDPLAVMEAARQGAIAVAHRFYDAPLDSAFLVRTFNGTPVPGEAWRLAADPANLSVAVRVTGTHVTPGGGTGAGGVVGGLDMELCLRAGNVDLMTVDGSFSWVSPGQWRAIRAQIRGDLAGSAPRPRPVADRADAASVGRTNPRNVVVGPLRRDADGTLHAELVVDVAHPFLFDHALDHVPGSLLLEAFRQCAIALAGAPDRRVGTLRSSFGRFVEFDRPATCVARVVDAPGDAGMPEVEVTLVQDGETCASARVGFLASETVASVGAGAAAETGVS